MLSTTPLGGTFLREVHAQQIIQVAQPAVATDPKWEPANGTRWFFVSAIAALTTDANVANRLVGVRFRANNRNFGVGVAVAVQPASTTYNYCIGRYGMDPTGGAVSSVLGQSVVLVPIPEDVPYLDGQWVFGIVTTNLQAGDQWGTLDVTAVGVGNNR